MGSPVTAPGKRGSAFRTRPWNHGARRTLAILPVVLAALTVAFAVIHLVPGDPVQMMLSSGGSVPSPGQEQALRHQLGLDQPLAQQYLSYLGHAVRGDFGRSIVTGEPVSQVIGAAIPASAALAGAGFGIAVVLGFAAALLTTQLRPGPARTVFDALPVFAMSMPAYWVAILLIQVFSFDLGLFPATGGNGAAGLVLPAITVALPPAGVIAQVLANALEAARLEPYIFTARAKGASPWRVLLRHALRNAVVPAITLLGTTVGNLLAASVVAETVFARQGLGRLTVTAITDHDFPVLQGVVVLLGVVYVLVNLCVDLLHLWVDPRVTTARRRDR
jgi:peptide/nickel transport system permease protein